MEGSFIIFNRLVGSMSLKWSHYLAFSEPTFRTCSPCGEAKDWPWLRTFIYMENLPLELLYKIFNLSHSQFFRYLRVCCQGVTVVTVTSVTPNYTHQIQLTWLLITTTCHQSSRALYQRTPPKQSLSGLKHSMLTHLTLLPFVYSIIVPVFRSQISTAPELPLVPLVKVKDWILADKTL